MRTAKELTTAQISAGDAVLTRLWCCVKNDGGRIDEQMNKVFSETIWKIVYNVNVLVHISESISRMANGFFFLSEIYVNY